MTRRQCQKCGRYAYSYGRCYADNRTYGRDVKEILYCAWASPQESQLTKHKKKKAI